MLDGTQTEAAGATPDTSSTGSNSDKTEKELSTIGFPYHHMEEALALARALSALGVPATRDQLAGAMSVPLNSTFIGKINSARTFGLIETGGGKVKLSQVGHDAISADAATSRAALAKSFLTVPLYTATYTEFRGRTLPASKGLENAFRSFGVSVKQCEKARQIFLKSAAFAGFFPNGRDRLIEPVLMGPPIPSPAPSPRREGSSIPDEIVRPAPVKEMNSPLNEPRIIGLLNRLPETGTEWGYERRLRWLQLFVSALDGNYRDTPAGTELGIRFIDMDVTTI